MASVADILLAQGQRAGNARRQQGAQTAGMWTNLADIIGQTGNAIVREQQDAPIRKQQQVIRDAQVAGIQKGAEDEKTLGTALQSPSRAKALKALEAQPELYDRAVKHYENIDNNMKRLLGSVAAGVREFGDSPEAALIGLGDLVDQGFDAQKLDQYRVHIIEHPESVSDIIDGLLKNSPDETHNRLVRPVAKPAEPFTLSKGQTRFGPDGKQIANVPEPVEAPKPKPDYTINGQRFSGDGTPIGKVQAPQRGTGTATSPDGQGANSLTPDAVDYVATAYRILGTAGIPTRLDETEKKRIINAATQQAKILGQAPAVAIQRQAAYKSDAKALDQMRKASSSAESFENKAIAQADLVRDLSQKVDRTKFPLINKLILGGKAELGDSQTQQLYNAITTFSAEYAKIIEGATGSAAGSSDSARKASERLIAAKMNKGTVKDVLDLMQKEMRYTINGYGATINHITERMGGTVPATPTETPKQIRYDLDGKPITNPK